MDATARSSSDRGERQGHSSLVIAGLRRVGVALCGLVLATAPALAHSGHSGHEGGIATGGPLPIAVIAGSVLVLGTSVYLGRVGELEGTWKDVGVLLGLVGLLAGVTLAIV